MPALKESDTPKTLVDFLMKKQIRNEMHGYEHFRRLQLLQGLIHQAPNRVYFNDQGEIMRALFFKGEFPYEAYWDIIKPQEENWEEARNEYLIGSTPKDIEDQLSFQRRRFGMKHDLLTAPSSVFKTLFMNEPIFVHQSEAEGKFVSCSYYPTPLFGFTPKFIAFDVKDKNPIASDKFAVLEQPSSEIVAYTHRF